MTASFKTSANSFLMSLDIELEKVCLSFNAEGILHFAVIDPMPNALQAARVWRSAVEMSSYRLIQSFNCTTSWSELSSMCIPYLISEG